MINLISVIYKYLKTLIKWVIVSVFVGTVGGVVGVIFHKSIDYVTEVRHANPWLILFLPLGGVIIAFLYNIFRSKGKMNTDNVIESVRDGKKVPFTIVPLIFIASNITHLLGGSAGREGAALQLGGGIGYSFARIFKLNKNNMRIVVMSGMSSVFSALFGTPLTAAIFSLEAANVGVFHYAALIPCVISSVVAYELSAFWGLTPVRFDSVVFDAMSASVFLKVGILSVLCAAVSIVFCISIKKSEFYMKKASPNKYLRGFIGGGFILLLTFLLHTTDYNGAGMEIINKAISGYTKNEAFILKIIFTAITVAAGFKGGEIVPAFFVGSTFGCAVSAILGLDATFAAAIGFVALFCGVVNCPIASIILSVEVFGTEGMLYFALACGICYMMSGNYSLYASQKIMYSKLNDDYIDEFTR